MAVYEFAIYIVLQDEPASPRLIRQTPPTHKSARECKSLQDLCCSSASAKVEVIFSWACDGYTVCLFEHFAWNSACKHFDRSSVISQLIDRKHTTADHLRLAVAHARHDQTRAITQAQVRAKQDRLKMLGFARLGCNSYLLLAHEHVESATLTHIGKAYKAHNKAVLESGGRCQSSLFCVYLLSSLSCCLCLFLYLSGEVFKGVQELLSCEHVVNRELTPVDTRLRRLLHTLQLTLSLSYFFLLFLAHPSQCCSILALTHHVCFIPFFV
mmetsp:Transcript_19904/g.50855  ORF Transcript_19904/g.50855 Transcript_19904/m.50855 type:complete len:269 (+) Transcript_19904:313-1119(+)